MLAIIIPYYKLSFFEDTLQSLTDQTDKRFKVYIGDDASQENPAKLLNQYKKKFNFIYHRFKKNLGHISLTKQWDRCINLTQGEEWLMILGDDDVIGKNVVEMFYSNYNAFNRASNVIRYSSVTMFENTNTFSSVFKHPCWENAYDSYYRRLTLNTRSSLSEYVFSLKSYIKFGFFDYPLASHSDDRAWIDFSDNLPIFSINDSIVYVRMSDLNVTGRKDNVEDKKNAQLNFYNFLVNEKLHHFSKKQKKDVLLKYEKIIFNHKMVKLKDCMNLFYIYLISFKIKEIIGLIKRGVVYKYKKFE